MRKSRTKISRGGFTLIEIMVVVIIIGILATLVIANVGPQGDIAKEKTTNSMLAQVASQIEMFKINHGRYPDSLDDLTQSPNWVKPGAYPQGGYLRKAPVDAWDHKLFYRKGAPTDTKPFSLVSLGADGIEGGLGIDADISY